MQASRRTSTHLRGRPPTGIVSLNYFTVNHLDALEHPPELDSTEVMSSLIGSSWLSHIVKTPISRKEAA
jgi:hypothetical protein